jgi:tungstate transport system substrate-binding protein
MIRAVLAVLCSMLACALAHEATAAESIVLASTTSVENSGLLARILPQFTAQTAIEVKVLALGTGQALAAAARGDADLVLVHDPEAEAAFIAAGHGINRREIAWNDSILVGPSSDAARLADMHDAVAALRAVAAAGVPFVSRGDGSGANALEKRLWREAGINRQGQGWYRDIGRGMGAALNIAAALNAVTLADRSTWLSFSNRRYLILLVAGDPRLVNRYDAIELDPARHPNIKTEAARRLAHWLAGPDGQAAIGAYQILGEQLFHPDADLPR